MINILMIILLMNSIIFFLMKTPLSMGLILLIQTITLTMISGMLSSSFWFAYILFLIMLGGMLILFIYLSSLQSNMKFSYNKKIIFIYIILLIFIYLMTMKLKIYLMFNLEMINMLNTELENNFLLKMSMNKLYNKPTNLIMMLMMNYLLLTLFIVVKIININLGPMRQKK